MKPTFQNMDYIACRAKQNMNQEHETSRKDKMQDLVIEDNTIYEVDSFCLECYQKRRKELERKLF